jgi:hypothetical protein
VNPSGSNSRSLGNPKKAILDFGIIAFQGEFKKAGGTTLGHPQITRKGEPPGLFESKRFELGKDLTGGVDFRFEGGALRKAHLEWSSGTDNFKNFFRRDWVG